MKLRSIIISALVCMMAVGISTAADEDKFAKGIDEFDAGRWSAAADLFRKAASEKPRDAVARLTAGVALATVGRYSEAVNEFDAAVRVAPQGIVGWMLLHRTSAEIGRTADSKRAKSAADALLASGKAFGAVGSSDRALSESLVNYPRNAIAECLLGDSLQLQGKLDAAKEHYAKAAALAPKWTKPLFNLGLAHLSTDAKAAEGSFRQVIALDPSYSQAQLWLGDALLKQGRFDEAIKAYSVAGNDKALDVESQIRIGNAQMQAGNFEQARQFFANAAAKAPKDPRAVAGIAQTYQNMGQPRAAEAKYDQANRIATQPSSQAVVYSQLAQVQEVQGKAAAAKQSYQCALELAPTLANAYALADSLNRSNKLSQTIETHEAALAKNPNDTRAMLFLLAAYKIKGNSSGRLDMAARLVKADPLNAATYHAEIGCARMALGDENGAMDAFAAAIDAGDASTWQTTGRAAAECGALDKLIARYDAAFAKRGDLRAGKVVFELVLIKTDTRLAVEVGRRLAARAPDDASVLLRLGQACERDGQTSEAIAAYTAVTALQDPAAASIARARINALKSDK